MDDPKAVQGSHPLSDALHKFLGVGKRRASFLEELVEGPSGDELHREPRPLVLPADFMNSDHVGVTNPRQVLRLTAKAR